MNAWDKALAAMSERLILGFIEDLLSDETVNPGLPPRHKKHLILQSIYAIEYLRFRGLLLPCNARESTGFPAYLEGLRHESTPEQLLGRWLAVSGGESLKALKKAANRAFDKHFEAYHAQIHQMTSRYPTLATALAMSLLAAFKVVRPSPAILTVLTAMTVFYGVTYFINPTREVRPVAVGDATRDLLLRMAPWVAERPNQGPKQLTDGSEISRLAKFSK